MLRNPISLKMSGLIASLLAGVASAQTSSDSGIADSGFGGSGSVDAGSRTLVGVCPSGAFIGTFTGANTQLGRTLRDQIPSTCEGKAYTDLYVPTTLLNYEAFTFANTSSAATCVTVNFDPNLVAAADRDAGAQDAGRPNPCGGNAFVNAYLGSYDPANQSENYIGDVGFSDVPSFSFSVPGLTDLVLVATTVNDRALCSFSLEVLNLPCAICGDGILPQTSCGDGVSSLGCDAGCSLASCGLEPPGLASEACDDGAASATCDVDCSLPVCGDGDVNVLAGEACDDGATTDGDGCSASCALEAPASGGNDGGTGGQSGSTATGSAAQGGQAGNGSSGEGGVGIGAPTVDDDGCNCHVAKANGGAIACLWGLALALAVGLRRRAFDKAVRR
jgi:cysteine-rich repeat protein